MTHTTHRRRRVAAIALAAGIGVTPLGQALPAAAAPESGCQVTSPAPGSTITEAVTVSGTYTDAYQVKVAFNAGTLYDAHTDDPDADGTGTWSYTFDPEAEDVSGEVEVTVRCSSLQDRYWRWGESTTVDVQLAGREAPVIDITSPDDGSQVNGRLKVSMTASDAQGIDDVQVRIDGGDWESAKALPHDRYFLHGPVMKGNRSHAIQARAIDTDGIVTTTATTYTHSGTGSFDEAPPVQSDRAMWVWESATAQLLENPGARDVLAAFVDDESLAPQRIKTLYIYADRYDGQYALRDHPDQYRSLIEWAHDRGYQVHALLGSGSYAAPMWSYERYHDNAVELMETVLNYNIASGAEERFDGVNIDIEPHGLADWRDASQTVQTQYLDMLSAMMDRKAASGEKLRVGAAIPRWLDDNDECQNITWHGTTQNCARHVIDTLDYVSLMDYRDVADGPVGIILHAQNEIEYAASVGKHVMVGVETDSISASGDPESISFQEEGRDAMEAELATVYAAFENSPAFLGIAMHHYDSLRVLPTEWSSDGTRWQSPVADESAPSTPAELTAEVYDAHRVDLHWSRSSDDSMVDHYEVHRSTTQDFTPDASTLVRTTQTNFAKDVGLTAGTGYSWKIIAVDIAGHSSSASAEASAITSVGDGTAAMRISSVDFRDQNTWSWAKVTVVDAETGDPVEGATVFGHFGGAAGKHFSATTDENGQVEVNTEGISTPYTVTFVPELILAPGYYWASSLDDYEATWNR